MELRAYAKINLSLDVIGRRDDGYHNISSLMQDVGLYDVIKIEKCSKSGTKYKVAHCSICNADVYLCSNVDTIPTDDSNLAVKGARALLETMLADGRPEAEELRELSIYIDKRLPVAAGIAGGSGNGAVTMLGMNALAGYPYSLRELMTIGAKVGADVPYSLMMNAKKNEALLADLPGIEEAGVAAMIEGIGDIVEPVSPIHKYVILANPGVSVSTREAYEAIDSLRDYADESGLFTNQLEKYTLANCDKAAELKAFMQKELDADIVLMSGSGPTMVAYYEAEESAKRDYERVKSNLGDGCIRMWLTETGMQ
ncbi:MAG: hypothetical protein KBS63_02275 [Clostridiales bacterium]|nr:hypothetical protein [Candidatus Crickella caballi]